jgi:hypothetical protein
MRRAGRVPRVLVQHQGALARRGRALVGCRANADHGVAFAERREKVPHPRRPGQRIELVLAERDPGGRRDVVVGAQRDHQNARFVHAGVRGDPTCGGIDCRHVELSETEDEGIRLVDERDRTASPKVSERDVLSSSPPNPAPRMRIRGFMPLLYYFSKNGSGVLAFAK